jgi:hypothetical protein
MNKVPQDDKDLNVNSLDEAIQGYKLWRKKISDFYITNDKVKEDDPGAYDILIQTNITDNEIMTLIRTYYKEEISAFDEKLETAEFELE